MSSRARELLERARAANQLDRGSGQRISEGVLEKLARGEGALPGIDVAPVVLPKLSLWSVLWSGSGFKSVLMLSAGVVSVASFTAVRAYLPEAEAHAPQNITAPAAAPKQDLPPAGDPPPAEPSAAKDPLVDRAQVRSRTETESVRALRLSRATSSSRDKPQATTALLATSRAAAANNGPSKSKPAAPATSEPSKGQSAQIAQPAPASRKATAAAMPQPAAGNSTTAKPAAASSHLDAELGLLRRAYRELHAGKPVAAQDLLDEHAARFPHGALEETREVAQMNVLCKMGRERAARVRAEQFLAARPKSPFAERVRNICSSQD